MLTEQPSNYLYLLGIEVLQVESSFLSHRSLKKNFKPLLNKGTKLQGNVAGR